MSELKSCPFCGGKARKYSYQYGDNGILRTYYTVECSECKAELPVRMRSKKAEEAYAAWNRRYIDD